MGCWVLLLGGLSWRMEMSRSEINTRGSIEERGCWGDRVVDKARLVPGRNWAVGPKDSGKDAEIFNS